MNNRQGLREGSESELSPSDETDIEEWRTRPQLCLIIENLPPCWMIGDLKAFLNDFGNVIKAEIFEDHDVQPFLIMPDRRLESPMDEE